MKLALRKSNISDIIAYRQIVLSQAEKIGLDTIVKHSLNLTLGIDNVFFIIKNSPADSFIESAFYPQDVSSTRIVLDKIAFDWKKLAIRVGMAASIYKHDNLLNIDLSKEDLSFIPKQIVFLYFSVCFYNKSYDGERMSDAPYFFGNRQCIEMLNIHEEDPGGLTEFAFSQICCLSYAHIGIVILAVRASTALYQLENKHIPVNIYCEPEYAANHHLLKYLEERKLINVLSLGSKTTSPIGLCDTFTILIAHAINLKCQVSTCMGLSSSIPLSLDESLQGRIYLQERLVENSSNSIKQKAGSPKSILRIGIHSRDSTYKNQSFQNYRDADIDTYIDATISALSKAKYFDSVVIYRFGLSDVRLRERPRDNVVIVDLWDKSGSVEQYNEFERTLYSTVDMFIGTTSGPAHIAHWLGIPTLFLDSTNLFSGCEYCQENSILALKSLKPLNTWWNLSIQQRSHIIKSDWIHNVIKPLNKYCKIESLSMDDLERTISEFLDHQLGIGKVSRLGELLGEYRYSCAVDRALIAHTTATTLKFLLSRDGNEHAQS